jgi:hypothetical protein
MGQNPAVGFVRATPLKLALLGARVRVGTKANASKQNASVGFDRSGETFGVELGSFGRAASRIAAFGRGCPESHHVLNGLPKSWPQQLAVLKSSIWERLSFWHSALQSELVTGSHAGAWERVFK